MRLVDEPVEWPCTRVETTHGILMDFVVDKVSTPEGGSMVRNYLRHPNSVGVIAVDDQGRVAIERQYRHPVRRRLIEAPAGLCDVETEDLTHTAQRELAEELGLAASAWSVLVDTYTTPGCSTQATRVFLARGLSQVPRPEGFVLEAEEADMAVDWARLDDLVDAIFAGQIMNPTLITGVLALRVAMLTGTVDALRPA
ncbi:MAG: NUDIX hydrolase [Propionibacteriaceae bacterium]|nr:NUDIX hydrolase [Propionibacteriaceae bacterium]